MYSWFPVAAALVITAVSIAGQGERSDVKRSGADTLNIERLATLEFPWGMAYLPDGRLLITEKPGRLRIFADRQLSSPVENLPAISYRPTPGEQGGLLDVAVDPDFARNRRIYLAYCEEATGPSTATETGDPRFASYLDLKDNRLRGGAVASATLDGHRLAGRAWGEPDCERADWAGPLPEGQLPGG